MLTLGRRILVAVNGSPASDKAAEEAVRLAIPADSSSPSTLFALYAIDDKRDPELKPSALWEHPDWQEELERVFFVVRKEAREAGVALQEVLGRGPLIDWCLGFAEHHQIDTLVLGSSHRGLVRQFFGSNTAARIACQAPCSVYIVR